ncbi:MAG: NAD(P)-dependent glycerol-3-phosphate dehydrogenase [Variibacter sp.]|nr:NAD(P)-dependent glycerol-3-phosphate dehydrogenase [Variibacter sp.]
MSFANIAVLGAGAWGTALANVLARAGCPVALWGRDETAIAAMAAGGENPHLPGVRLAAGVTPTTELGALATANAVLMVVPAQAVRQVAHAAAAHIRRGTPVIACSKGIERGTHLFMTEVVRDAMPAAVPAILSGPGFAEDVARGLPTAVTLAAQDEALAQALAQAFGGGAFRPYHTTDVRGVEIGGAAKNVLAIATGIAAGRRLGAGAAAAVTTRGFAELMRVGRALGANPETLMGLSGLGDLLLTCSSPQSRNFSLGLALGEGHGVPQGKLAEGALTAPVLVEMARAKGIAMPIAEAVDAVLAGRLAVDAAIESLLNRPLRSET